jgi:hypothetical protein
MMTSAQTPLLPPELGIGSLGHLAELLVEHDLALFEAGPSLRLGMESALDHMSFRWRPLAPHVLCVLLPSRLMDRPALLALCGPHVPAVWIWQRGAGWQAVSPLDGRVLREVKGEPLAPW